MSAFAFIQVHMAFRYLFWQCCPSSHSN